MRLLWKNFPTVVSYSISTSNHNHYGLEPHHKVLYLIPFLHQTTTLFQVPQHRKSCILFHFYIKPQLCFGGIIYFIVVSYSISTSNHNIFSSPSTPKNVVSYSISTSNHNFALGGSSISYVVSYSISTSNHNIAHYLLRIIELYLIPFLHQTTTCSA